MSVAGILLQLHPLWAGIAGLVVGAFALIVFGLVQARWFAQHLKRGLLAGFGFASVAMVESLMVVLLTSPLFT